MKKSLALLALASLFIGTTSCRKKDEPKPTPVVSTDPNTADASADVTAIKSSQAVLTVPAGSVVYIKPQTGLKILGATMDATDKTKYTVGSNGLLGINGNVEKLELESDDITDLTLSKPSPLLKTLVLVTKDQYAKKVAETKIDLSGLTDLESLLIAGYTIKSLDLTKLTKLKNLGIGAWELGANFPELTNAFGSIPEKASRISEVKLPANNVIENFMVRTATLQDGKCDFDNLPKLKKFFCQSPYFSNFTFAKSTELEILYATSPTAGIKLNADLGNKPKLKDITFKNATLSKFAVSNATNVVLKDSNAGAIAVEFDNIPAVQAAQYIGNGAARSTVKSITLKNMELTEDLLVKIIKRLQTSGGTIKVKSELLTTAVNAALSAKGWTGTAL
jgi:lipoprotein